MSEKKHGTEARQRTHQIGVRLFPEEYEAATAHAAKLGISLGELFRRAVTLAIYNGGGEGPRA